jgi:hypothetical protein
MNRYNHCTISEHHVRMYEVVMDDCDAGDCFVSTNANDD